MSYEDTYHMRYEVESKTNYKIIENDKRSTVIRIVIVSVIIFSLSLYEELDFLSESPFLLIFIYVFFEWSMFDKRSDSAYQKEVKELERDFLDSYVYQFRISKVIPDKYFEFIHFAPQIELGKYGRGNEELNVMLLSIEKSIGLIEYLKSQQYTSVNHLYICRKDKDKYKVVDEISNTPNVFINKSSDYMEYCEDSISEASAMIIKYRNKSDHFVAFQDVDFPRSR